MKRVLTASKSIKKLLILTLIISGICLVTYLIFLPTSTPPIIITARPRILAKHLEQYPYLRTQCAKSPKTCPLYKFIQLLLLDEKYLIHPEVHARLPPRRKCDSNLKIFVYILPREYTVDVIMKNRKETGGGKGDPFCVNDCPASQFALEIFTHRFFMKSCMRTWDPEEGNKGTWGFYLLFFT